MIYELDLACINIPTKVGLADQEECFEETARRADLFGINEVFDEDAERLYRRLAVERRLGQWGTKATPNPVFWKHSRFNYRGSNEVKLHGRGPWFDRWPGYNSARYATKVTLEPEEIDRLITVVNTHLVPNGRKVPDDWRDRMRKRSKRRLRRMCRNQTVAGRIFVLLGDMNIRREFKMPDNFVWLRGVGIDKIGIGLPEGVELVDYEVETYRAPTDHKKGIRVRVRLRVTTR